MITDAKIIASVVLIFFKYLNNNPEINPAKPLFNKHTRIVPMAEYGINVARVLGAIMTITPWIKPRNNPAKGPYIIAPIAIGARAKVILTGPNVM